MARIIFAALLVVLLVCAVNSCTVPKDCPCGSVCYLETCAAGCMLYDTFMVAGSEAWVYGRKCRCGNVPDERGLVLECKEGVEFIGVPEGVEKWQYNPSCEPPSIYYN